MSGIMMMTMASSLLVKLSPRSISDLRFTLSPTDSVTDARFILDANGEARFTTGNSGSGTYAGEWLLGGSSSEYEVRFTVQSGTTTVGTVDTWLSLANTRQIGISLSRSSIGTTIQEATVLVEIRRVSGTVIASATVFLSCTSTVDI